MLKPNDFEEPNYAAGAAARIKEALGKIPRGGRQPLLDRCIDRNGKKGITAQAITGWKNNGRVSRYNLAVLSEITGFRLEYLISGELPKLKSDYIDSYVIRKELPHDKSVMELPDNSVSTDKSINSQVDSHEFTALSQENPPMLKGERAINWRESIEQYQLGTDEGMIKNIPITPNTFGFDVVGDEMAPDFKDGARVSIDPDKHPEDLKCALVEIDGDLAIRRLRRINGEWWLTLANPAYADMKKPLSEARFIGMITSKVEVTIY